MKLLSTFLLIASAVAMAADELTYTKQPGCFSGTARSIVSASKEKGTHISYPDGESEGKEYRNSAQVVVAFEKISGMVFNKGQLKFLEELSETTGPDYCVLHYRQNDHAIEISFPANIASDKYASLILKSKANGSYEEYELQDLKDLLKNIQEIQTLMASLETTQAEQ